MAEEEVTYTCSSGIACGGSATVANYGDPCAACLHEGRRRKDEADRQKAAAREEKRKK